MGSYHCRKVGVRECFWPGCVFMPGLHFHRTSEDFIKYACFSQTVITFGYERVTVRGWTLPVLGISTCLTDITPVCLKAPRRPPQVERQINDSDRFCPSSTSDNYEIEDLLQVPENLKLWFKTRTKKAGCQVNIFLNWIISATTFKHSF